MAEFVYQIWRFMSGWTIPFLGISCATLVVTLLVINLSLDILKIMLGLGRGKLSHHTRPSRPVSTKKEG